MTDGVDSVDTQPGNGDPESRGSVNKLSAGVASQLGHIPSDQEICDFIQKQWAEQRPYDMIYELACMCPFRSADRTVPIRELDLPDFREAMALVMGRKPPPPGCSPL